MRWLLFLFVCGCQSSGEQSGRCSGEITQFRINGSYDVVAEGRLGHRVGSTNLSAAVDRTTNVVTVNYTNASGAAVVETWSLDELGYLDN